MIGLGNGLEIGSGSGLGNCHFLPISLEQFT